MLRLALPGLGNNWLALLKDTSLVSVIALDDLLRMSFIASQSTRAPFEFYAVACALYLAMTAVSTFAIARAELAAPKPRLEAGMIHWQLFLALRRAHGGRLRRDAGLRSAPLCLAF